MQSNKHRQCRPSQLMAASSVLAIVVLVMLLVVAVVVRIVVVLRLGRVVVIALWLVLMAVGSVLVLRLMHHDAFLMQVFLVLTVQARGFFSMWGVMKFILLLPLSIHIKALPGGVHGAYIKTGRQQWVSDSSHVYCTGVHKVCRNAHLNCQ